MTELKDRQLKKEEEPQMWLIVIFILIGACFGFAPSGNAEDYTSEIKKLHFGDKLRSQTYSLQNDWTFPTKTFFTSYNPEVGQTDSSPCIGANGTNVCDLYRQGVRTIALSQDMVGRADWKQYRYGDTVVLYSSEPQCNGVFQIEDTLNKRYTNRGDIFCLTRECNTSCWVTITKLSND